MPPTYTYLLGADWPRADLAIGDGTWNSDRFEFEDGEAIFVLTVPVLGSPGPWTDARSDYVLGQCLHAPGGENAPTVVSATLRRTPADLASGEPVRSQTDPDAHRLTLTVTFGANRDDFKAFAGAPLRALVDSALEAIGRTWADDQKVVDALLDNIRGEAIAW